MNILEPEGNMGSRLGGGKDAASPRYIFTRLSDYGKVLFDKRDSPVLNYLQDDGNQIEPDFFVPVLPIVLINGCEGIGTGYSTTVPSFNPRVIIENLNALLEADTNGTDPEITRLVPWYKDFKGTVTAAQRMGFFREAIERLPRGVPVNTILQPMEGDPIAASAFWRLAVITNGAFMSPAPDWP